ncbi:MAG: site-2 protease family protein [Deltaproteobacteria bacterium]|nr:site-2 protease family protein [Deltaproteobacteria bacterium]MBN2673514.1 site-2 protease family protein [Deltaproteobacteria bacterium]
MNFSWKIFTAFGIPVRLHFSMVIIPFLAFTWVEGTGIEQLIVASILTILLFGSVLLHEFGHALTGRRYGVHTADIVLTPIGGMARMTNIPQNPKQEIAISIAGPLVSFAIAGVSFALLLVSPQLPVVHPLALEMLHVLFQLNLMLGLFNLIPALPMDGGRVFRGLLALKFSHLKATQIASKIGKLLAVAGGIYGIMESQWTLVFIAFFIYTAAGQEERIANMREAYKQAQKDGASFGGSPFGASPFGNRGYYVYKESRRPAAPKDDWYDDNASPRNARVVEGGKVEILSRKDPE